jgi:hypothetical protein
MSYIINTTDGQILITIPDGTADGPDINAGLNASDINLFGKNYATYGELQNENFIKLLQNFANTTPPLNPLKGELWYDTNNKFLKVYNGQKFVKASPVWVSSSAPATTLVGDQWWDTVNEQFKVYNGNTWRTVGPAYSILDGISGAIVENIADTNGALHTVVKTYTNGNVVSIASYDAAFTPAATIPGFAVINPGINMNSVNNNNYLQGTATNSLSLGSVTASNYARTDVTPTFQANLNIAGSGVSISATPLGDAAINNKINGGDFSIYNNVSGAVTRTLYIDGGTGAVQVSQDPITAMGVATKQYVDTVVTVATTPLAPKINPQFSGVPTAPTPAVDDNSTTLPTTAFVKSAIAASTVALWQGSAKFVSNTAPNPFMGSPGDFWFQI